MPDMGYEAIKKVLLQVKDMCRNNHCTQCPLRKFGEESHVAYCPMHENEDGIDIGCPQDWEIDEWRDENKC